MRMSYETSSTSISIINDHSTRCFRGFEDYEGFRVLKLIRNDHQKDYEEGNCDNGGAPQRMVELLEIVITLRHLQLQ